MEFTGIEIESLDIIDVLRIVTKKKRKFLAMLLTELEQRYPKDSLEYLEIRKLILDSFNDFTRSILRTLFGDIEGLVMK